VLATTVGGRSRGCRPDDAVAAARGRV